MLEAAQRVYIVLEPKNHGFQFRKELEISLKLNAKDKNRQASCRSLSVFGPSGATRTPGILLPKQARYQLRYTRR